MAELGSPVRSQISVEDIAKAIALSWQEDGRTTGEMLTPAAVYLYERKLVEWVFGDAKSAAEFSDTFKQIRKRGIEVSIVLRCRNLDKRTRSSGAQDLISTAGLIAATT